MASEGREENGAGTSSFGSGSGSGSSGGGGGGGQSGEVVRSWDVDEDDYGDHHVVHNNNNATPSTSPPYWDSDDDDSGPRPSDLYGKFTWKIENFSQISKRELRSNVFEVGGYKWYILVYPQGCDVCNHLSLFLCVSDYDKLLPGWSHFAQFTIAVVNKDPKKSKYSDTLHRFCKKEHDWGWKKFMELSKVLDGFIVADILVIKAQVQVIRENPHRPFRCLNCQYRRELVRVYLTNVEGICRRFVEEKRDKLGKLIEDNTRWSSFCAFWCAIEENVRHRLSREKTEVILKAVVKRFFNEKEVTSTLVMDALYSGCKALNYGSRNKKEKTNDTEVDSTTFHVVWVEKDTFVLADDVLSLMERAATEPLPPFKEDKGPQNRTKDSSGDDFGKDTIERDERRLTELGRRTIEIFVLAHLFSNHVEVAYREAIALKRQEELIREEEAAGQAEIEVRARREAAEREKRSKKKQAKQKRNNRKDRDRSREEKSALFVQGKDLQDSSSRSRKLKEHCSEECAIPNPATGTAEDDDDLSGLDSTDNVVGTLGPALEDGDIDHADWDRDGSETHQAMEASFSGDVSMQPAQSGHVSRKHQAAVDDSSSTCSTDSHASVGINSSYKVRPSFPDHSQLLTRVKARSDRQRYNNDGSLVDVDNFRRGTSMDLNSVPETSSSCGAAGLNAEMVIHSLEEHVQWLEQRLVEKEDEVVVLKEKLSLQQQRNDTGSNKPFQERTADFCSSKDSSSSIKVDEGKHDGFCLSAIVVPSDSTKPSNQVETLTRHAPANHVLNKRNTFPRCDSMKSNTQLSHSSGKLDQINSATVQMSNTESSSPLQCNKSVSDESLSSARDQSLRHCSGSTSEVMGVSRPSSAPLIPGSPRRSVPDVSMQTVQSLSRSVSALGRLGAGESTNSNGTSLCQSPVTPSYKMAAVGKIRSPYSGHAPHPVSSVTTTASPGPFQCSSAQHSSGFVQNLSPSLAYLPCSITASPQPTHRIGVQGGYSSGQTRSDGSPSLPRATGSYVFAPQLSSLVGPENKQSFYTAVNQSECPVGFTFGSVTPEILNRQRSYEHTRDLEDSISQAQDTSLRVEHNEQEIFLEQYMQQQSQGLQNLKAYQVHSQQDSHDIRVQTSIDELGMQGSPMHVYPPPNDIRQAGSVVSEDFPHIDIINDLLDDGHYRGTAFSVLERINSGHLHSDVNLLNVDRVEMARLHEDGLFQLHSSSDPSSIGLRESLQMVPPYTNSPYGQSYNQQGNLFEGITPRHWPMATADFSGANVSNNGYSGINAHIAYAIHGNHLPLGDSSSFTSGQNDYIDFSPRKDL